MTEENKNLNPQAEGSNTAFGRKNKDKERATEIGGNFASSSRNTGGRVDRINIADSLDLVIKDNEKLSVNLAGNSEVNLEDNVNCERYKNNLYRMNKNKRQELSKKFTGLDKILYDKLEKKIGKYQWWFSSYNDLEAYQEHSFTSYEVKEIINELGITTKNQNTELLKNIKLAVVEGEKKHKEQVEDLEDKIRKGEKSFNDQKTQLQTEKEARKKAEQEKTEGINKTRKEAKTALDKAQSEKETESSQLKKEIENLTQQLAAITKTYNEETIERQKLEKIITETAERINNNSLLPDLTKIELHEAKEKIVQLSQTIEAQRGIITAGEISLKSREKKIEDWKKTLEDVNARHETEINAKIEEHNNRINEIRAENSREINEQAERYNKLLDENTKEINRLIDKEANLTMLKILFESEQKKLENAEARLNRADTEIIKRGKEITTWKNKAEINEANLRDAKTTTEQLRNQLREAEKEKEPTWYQIAGNWIGEKTGFTAAKNAISNILNIVIIVAFFYGFSLLWKHLIKPTLANFKSDKKEKIQPEKKRPVKYDDYEEVVESKEKPQSLPDKQPTIIINNRTPAEKELNQSPVISKEPVKQEEISTQISSEKTDLISEEKKEKEKPAQNGKNGKKSKRAKKGKK